MKRIQSGWLAGAVMMLAVAAQGEVIYRTWTGATNTLWNNTGNWAEGATVPSTLAAGAECVVVFAQSGAANLNTTTMTSVTAWMHKLTFNDNVGTNSPIIALRTNAGLLRNIALTGTSLPAEISVSSGVSGNITVGGGAGEGSILVDTAWTVDHQGSGILSLGPIVQRTGSNGRLTKTGDGALVLTGTNSYLHGTVVNGGSLTLAENAQMLFRIGTNGVNAALTGSATAVLDGEFLFDLSGAGTTVGDSWSIVDVGTLDTTFGSTFAVVGFDDAGGNKWVKDIDGTKHYEFSEGTGVLAVVIPDSEPPTAGVLSIAYSAGTVAVTVTNLSPAATNILWGANDLLFPVWSNLVTSTGTSVVEWVASPEAEAYFFKTESSN